jgi:hypothetical protein
MLALDRRCCCWRNLVGNLTYMRPRAMVLRDPPQQPLVTHTCRGRTQHLVIGVRSDAMDFERRYATSALDRTRALNDVMLEGS